MQKIRYVGGYLLLAFVLPLALACGRPSQSGSSVIRIEIPKSAKMGALQALPAGARVCFGASITGDGISGRPATSCSPAMGLMAGYVEQGQPIAATVDYGSNRRVDVYMIVMGNSTDSCPAMGSSFSSTQFNRTFLVGSSAPFSINSPETRVDVQSNYTGVPIGATFPSSCFLGSRISASNPNGFSFGVAGGTVTDDPTNLNPSIILRARVGQASGELHALDSSGIVLKVK